MGKLIDLYNRLLSMTPAVVESKTLEVVKENERQVTDLNREQLLNSEDSNQEPLGTYASIAYANLKGKNEVDLKLTGDFHESIFIKAEKYPIVFGATDKKSAELFAKYGEEVLGLTRPSKNEVAQNILKPSLQQWIRDVLHL
jgi:cell pole-organizing protein PopZ